tara:strand:+ start:1708 stop:2034 length:327 start_codon:yes stop_codon:yes gene_type:complete
MKKNKVVFQVLFLTIFLMSCQSVKDGLEGKKISKGEEFLIEKKNPLEVPPDFEVLPLPRNSNDKVSKSKDEFTDIEKLLKKTNKSIRPKITNKSTTTEESILKKIKVN